MRVTNVAAGMMISNDMNILNIHWWRYVDNGSGYYLNFLNNVGYTLPLNGLGQMHRRIIQEYNECIQELG